MPVPQLTLQLCQADQSVNLGFYPCYSQTRDPDQNYIEFNSNSMQTALLSCRKYWVAVSELNTYNPQDIEPGQPIKFQTLHITWPLQFIHCHHTPLLHGLSL